MKSITTISVIEVYDLIAPAYFEKREHMALMQEIDLLCGIIPKGGKILDAGCGNGRDSQIFAERGYEVTGIDFSDGQLDYARRRKPLPNLRFMKKNLLELEFPEGSYDGIWCCAVLPHFNPYEVRTILKSFSRILVKDGYAVIILKEGCGEVLVKESEFDNIERYVAFYSEADVREMANESKLKVERLYRYNERERFEGHRNMDFIVSVLRK